VNIPDVLHQAEQYIEERKPQITRFEAACTSDPLSIEHLTGNLRRLIEFMGGQEFGRLRFVTKYDQVDSLLDARHNGHTRFRFSVNARYVIKNFEPSTAPLEERIEAARKAVAAGYPLVLYMTPWLHRFKGRSPV
jgi:spore photoproduct lyase